MMRSLVGSVLWLSGGTLLALALYWTLLNTPDSNVLMLTGSALVAIAIVAVLAMTVGGVVVLMRDGAWSRGVLRVGLAALPWFVLSLIPLVSAAWLTSRADTWLAVSSGEISAWFIARLGWADVSRLLASVAWALAWLRWVVGPWLGLTLFVTALEPTRPPRFLRAWIRRACNVRLLALATFWFVVFLALPWHLALWTPTGLPPTWIEPLAAALRLLFVALAMATGAALIVRTAARRTPPADIVQSSEVTIQG